MKKLFYFFACAAVAFVACTEKAETGTDGPVIVNDGDIILKKGEVLDADTQKEKLEQIGMKFLSVFPAKEYEDMLELSEILYSHCDRYFYDDSYDWTEVNEALDGISEDLWSEKQRGDYKWEYTYTLFLSNCTGTVTLGKRAAEYTKSDVTKVILEDVEGEDWEATLVAKNLREVFLGEWLDAYSDYDYYAGEYVDFEETYNITVEIPESLTFEVERDGQFVATVTVNFDYSIGNDGVEYDKSRFGVSVEIKIDDLVMTLEQASVDAATGQVVWSQSLTKNGMFIVSQKLSASADVEYEEEDGEVVDAIIKESTVNFEFNLLGELQIKGGCSDFVTLVETMAEDFETERQCERAAERATELMEWNVYYDCTETVQASIEFEPVAEYDSYYGTEYYWIEPVIVFDDGSRYSFEKYFKERDFRDLLDSFEDFVMDYEDMVEDIYR